MDDKSIQHQNCINFITSYACWCPHRQLYQTGIMFCRFTNMQIIIFSLYLQHIKKYSVYFRFLYVRNASGLIKDNAKLLHLIIMIFIATYHCNRVGLWVVLQRWKGLNYEVMPLGKFCMNTNLTLTWHGEMDEDYFQRAQSFRTQVVVSMVLFSIALTYVCIGALVAR